MKRVPIIEMKEISKSFPGVIANHNVDFRVYPGEIHALLGENGAGKSTLMSILAGLYRPDSGVIKVRGESVNLRSPRYALENGIGMIYQHFRLIKNFTVAENIVLGSPKANLKTNKSTIEKETIEIANKYGLKVKASSKVGNLSLGEQQRVEILKMLYRGCDVLIMDEPTTVLTPQEVRELFVILRKMADQGKAVVLITHKLDEVMEIADYVTVLRKGIKVGEGSTKDLNQKTLTNMMVAKEVVFHNVNRSKQPGDSILELKNLKVKSNEGYLAVKSANLNIRKGEILAIAGVAGNGQKELLETIAGLRKQLAGNILYKGDKIDELGIRERLELGITMIPEDRLGTGLVPNLDILDNAILRNYYKDSFINGFLLNYRSISKYTKSLVNSYNIYLSDVRHPINYLSGGNMQKLLLARELYENPQVLLASYPVRGLDIAAANAVYDTFLEEREKGTAILLVLEDLDDIFRLADRVAVMYDGQIKGLFNVEDVDIEKIGALMLGATVEGGQDA